MTHGSYLANRLYDLLKHTGEKVSVTLPKRLGTEDRRQQAAGSRQKAEGRRPKADNERLPFGITPYHCTIRKRSSREVHKTEVFITFRIAYYSNEKFEELITTGVDVEGNLLAEVEFPYTPASLEGAVISRVPYTRKHTEAIYEKCLRQVRQHAEQKALTYQETLAKHYYQDIARLGGYYQQMIDEIPEITENRESSVRQLQNEYEVKASEELKKCQLQISIKPINFCTVTIPFRRYSYLLEHGNNTRTTSKATVDVLHNLFSGTLLYPHCDACGKEMKEIGICEANAHAVCRHCLITCHECGALVCLDCEIQRCTQCGEWVCRQCSEDCYICGKRYCGEHLLGNVENHKHFCRQCAVQCEKCGKLVGKIHAIECDISHKQVCLDCVATCSCCDQHVERTYIHTCSFCGQQMCSECTFRCEVCGEIFCVHHITECEISGKMVCPRHSGTCRSCSQQVSTACLHTCDLCRKKICSACSVQCHGCDAFFCEDHVGEMATCPECKRKYCSLCYSGQGICVACQKKFTRSQ